MSYAMSFLKEIFTGFCLGSYFILSFMAMDIWFHACSLSLFFFYQISPAKFIISNKDISQFYYRFFFFFLNVVHYDECYWPSDIQFWLLDVKFYIMLSCSDLRNVHSNSYLRSTIHQDATMHAIINLFWYVILKMHKF